MKVRIYRFNMIEVLLAIVVVTLAITGVFALFPVGLNASKSATADNSISDIAEYVIAHVRADIQTKATDKDAGNGFEEIDDLFSDAATDTGTYDGSDDSNDVIINKGKGLYLIRQLSGPEDKRFEDFTAYAKVFVDTENKAEDDKFLQYGNNQPVTYSPVSSKFHISKFYVPVVLELSYPATVPYAEREKRYFRFEIFNDRYDPNAAAAAPGD